MLMGCSTDGKVCVINFSDGELGTPITDDAKNQKIKQMYGDIIAFSSDIIENVDLLDQKRNRVVIKQEPMSGSDDEENLMEFIEKRRIMSPTPLFKNIPSPTMIPIIIPDDPEPSFPNYYLQKEEIIDGTRRITPLFLGKYVATSEGSTLPNLILTMQQGPGNKRKFGRELASGCQSSSTPNCESKCRKKRGTQHRGSDYSTT